MEWDSHGFKPTETMISQSVALTVDLNKKTYSGLSAVII